MSNKQTIWQEMQAARESAEGRAMIDATRAYCRDIGRTLPDYPIPENWPGEADYRAIVRSPDYDGARDACTEVALADAYRDLGGFWRPAPARLSPEWLQLCAGIVRLHADIELRARRWREALDPSGLMNGTEPPPRPQQVRRPGPMYRKINGERVRVYREWELPR
jgi:hypothetical protein